VVHETVSLLIAFVLGSGLLIPLVRGVLHPGRLPD
jgi:hypothetical protein